MDLSLIKNEAEYERSLSELNALMDLDPLSDSDDGKKLGLLAFLIEAYEREGWVESVVDPVDAIRFRMEQQNLNQSDLVPFIGTRARVSEILSRKRPLSLSMIRSLHLGLGIPAKSLIQEPCISSKDITSREPIKDVEWEKFPIREMLKRGWLKGRSSDIMSNLAEHLSPFFGGAVGLRSSPALFKKSERFGRPMNKHSLAAWTARILNVADERSNVISFVQGSITLEFMRELVHLSLDIRGPLLARNALLEKGILLVVESQLPKTYLDGAALLSKSGNPVIGLTLRYDRLDNFWFCLMHELAHISLHFGQGWTGFYDDLDVKQSEDPRELEADKHACEALIPTSSWQKSVVPIARSRESIYRFAAEINVHPAIVAGRLRRELNSYHVFNDLVGHGQVRHLFTT